MDDEQGYPYDLGNPHVFTTLLTLHCRCPHFLILSLKTAFFLTAWLITLPRTSSPVHNQEVNSNKHQPDAVDCSE